MKTLFRCLIATCALAGSAYAADTSCEVTCENTVKMCSNTCKQLKSQGQGDKVAFCQTKCKEFEDVCKKNCQNKPKRKP
jgi:hypothetical protein